MTFLVRGRDTKASGKRGPGGGNQGWVKAKWRRLYAHLTTSTATHTTSTTLCSPDPVPCLCSNFSPPMLLACVTAPHANIPLPCSLRVEGQPMALTHVLRLTENLCVASRPQPPLPRNLPCRCRLYADNDVVHVSALS